MLGVKLLPAETDFALVAPAPFAFTRSYVSSDARDSALGPGWSIPGEGLGLEVSDTATVLIDAQGRRITFGPLAPGEARFSPSEALWIRRGGPVVPQAEALAPWTGRWAFIPEALQHQPEAIFVVRGTEALHFAPQGEDWRLVAEFDAHGYRTEFAWRQGRPATVVDSAGRRYLFFYVMVAERSRLHGVALVPTSPSPFAPRDTPRTPYGVDPHAPETDWLVRYDYDSAARLVAVRDRSGQIVREFTWTGSVMAGHSQPGGIALHYAWDTPGPEGRVLRQTETDGLSRQFAYHAGHTEVTDSLGRTERYDFEGEGPDTRWTGHTRADGSQLAFEYDGFGRQIASIDPLGRRTTSRYDGQGRLTARSLPDGSAWHYALDDDTGAAREIRGPEGQTWKIQRDERARPVLVTAPDGTTTAYTYDDIDLPDRPTTITDARGGVRRLEWNRLGQLTTHTDCSGRSHRFDYDGEGRLLAERNALGEATRYEHDRLGRVIAVYRPDDSRIAYQYDTLGRVTQLTRSAKGEAHPRTDTLVWDRFGRLTAYRDAGGLTQRYRYDVAGRMVALINENEAQTHFAYDALDRLITETGFDRRTQHYTYNAAGELIARTEASLPEAPVTRYEHNAVGRLIARHLPATACAPAITEHFAWRADGQLASFTSPTAEVRFAFDAAGRVVRESQSHTNQTADPWHYACAHRYGL
ncbi:DUF6531 domain-containing protein, partial [Parazoarcus communis]|uniref:DUF6531 domain-containing protein n=1 Tax=Parazoarcus communis TaxID=41977 RepID=UPI0010582D8E